MSLLPPEVSAELAQLLQQLQSPDNSVRSMAETNLQEHWTSQRADVLLMGLAEQLATSGDISVSVLPLSSRDSQSHPTDVP